jgi:RNA polymerase sigma-70 factor (ECF subfamily)
MDEQALIGEALRGDLDSFNRLVMEYQDRAFGLAYRILGDPDSAADAAQEAFISAFRNLRQYRGGSFRAWLLRIVTNACYDELRRRKRRPTTSIDDLGQGEGPDEESRIEMQSVGDGPEEAAESRELAEAIENCLKGLPQEFRTVAVLADVLGFGYQEIGQTIGTPVGTVKSRLARARARLRDCLQTYRELLPPSFRLEDEAIG